MDAIRTIEEVSGRLSRDLESFDSEMTTLKSREYPMGLDGRKQKLEDSLNLILNASALLTSLISLKVKLNRTAEDEGAYALAGSRRVLNSELTDVIQSVRTTLSSLTERNRTLRDIFSAETAKASQTKEKLDS